MRATTKRSARRVLSSAQAKRSARWIAQREHLLQAAQRAIHRDGPQLSMEEIAAEAGITKPILYRHFGDRRGLARALRDSTFGLVLGVTKDDPASARRAARERVAALYPVVDDPDELRRVVVGFAAGFQMFVGQNRSLYRFLRTEGVLDQMWEESGDSQREPVAESLASSLRALFRERGIDDATAQVWAHALRGMVVGVVDWWTEALACDRFELERHFDLMTRALIAGLGQALSDRSGRARSPAARRARPPERAGRKKAPRVARRAPS